MIQIGKKLKPIAWNFWSIQIQVYEGSQQRASDTWHVFTSNLILTLSCLPFTGINRSEERRVGKECRSLCDWSSDVCSSDLDPGIRGIAATCIGHLARIHQQLDLDLILPALYRHQSDPGKYVAGNVDNALSSIERFMQVPVKRDPAMRGDSEGEEIAIEEEEDEEEQPLTTEEVERAFGSGNILEIEKTLTALAFRNPDDWQRTEAYCLEFLEHPNDSVRSVAADCIRHLVSNYKVLDLDLVLPALYRHRSDPSQSVVKSVDLALRTIERILKIPVQRLGEAQDRDKK